MCLLFFSLLLHDVKKSIPRKKKLEEPQMVVLHMQNFKLKFKFQKDEKENYPLFKCVDGKEGFTILNDHSDSK